jgi:hypothetical protein
MSVTVAALEEAHTDADVSEPICHIRGDRLDDADTHETVYHILGTDSYTWRTRFWFLHRHKLKQLPIWDLWLALGRKQLEAH